MNPTMRLEVSIDDQALHLIEEGKVLMTYPVSTAAKGMGFGMGSYRTPTGRFRICEKIGGGEPWGTIFQSRVPVGRWQEGEEVEGDLVLTRILRLEGLEPENANTKDRYIYVHGTNREHMLGEPASHGCVRLANDAMIELFERVPVGTELTILPQERRRGKLLFIDCDSTLSTIEGIDELGRACGEEVFARVVALTDAAMNGEIPIAEVFPRRMEMIRPGRDLCERIAQLYIDTMVAGAAGFVRRVKAAGWQPVILSGGFAPLIRPLARELGIEHVEAVPLFHDEDGAYLGYGMDYPTTRNLGKNEVIREWKSALLPERVVMIGDGVSDLETRPDVDLFVGFGGVVERKAVKEGADYWLSDMSDADAFFALLDEMKVETGN